MPRFSVIIATYNWSSALKLTLESVSAQTYTDFEVLVVGDACTDDSEAIVRAFGDNRFHWWNLPENCGSQWGPNNHGLSVARGEYVAYLGHDDLWWPTHLAAASEVFERTGADIVAAATLLYGPPGSGIRSVTGFFPNDIFSPRHFFPPSSTLHRTALAQRVGGWRPPELANIAVDVDFLVRCYEAGARFASTGEFTTFKFNTAWRRDAYRWRDPFEQRAFLAHMRRDGEVFRRKELSAALRAATEDRLHRIEISPSLVANAAARGTAYQDFKGSRKAGREAAIWVDGCLRVFPGSEYAGFEWHGLEQHPSLGAFRWSGPSPRSTIIVPAPIDAPLEVRLLLVCWIKEDILRTARLQVNGVEIATVLEPGEDGAFLWSGSIDPDCLPADDRAEIRLTILVDRTYRPLDLEANEDRRWLGLAVGRVELTKTSTVQRER